MSDIDISDFPDTAVILDSNAWVFTFTDAAHSYSLITTVTLRNDLPIYVSAYIFDEVFAAFDRSLAGSAVEDAKQRFAEFVAKHDLVHGPTQRELRDMDVDRVRSQPEVEMLARSLGVQAKDVPILVLAWQVRDESPTIFTEDKSFAEFDAAAHSFPEMRIGRWRHPKEL